MKRQTQRLVLGAVLLIATTALAQERSAGAQAKGEAKAPVLKIIAPQLFDQIVLMAKSATVCDLSKDLVCEIQMTTIRYPDNANGKYYCVAIAPEVSVPKDTSTGVPSKRWILWKLSDTTVLGKPVAFHDDSGIIITLDTDAQIDRRGTVGGGSIGAGNRFFHTWTRRNKPGASATYLPVVLWGPAGYEELCAAIDPKIVNTN